MIANKLPVQREGGARTVARLRWRLINISPVQLDRATLADEVLDIVQIGLPPAALTIEITEGAISRNQVRATGILNGLKQAGVIISLDDFGTAYSTLSMLDVLPLDKIKLDGRLPHPSPGNAQGTSFPRP